ncbi:hypothetical protein SISNIDRAFT_495067, partial [Sistotremastrum niveocremeum HHB9708]
MSQVQSVLHPSEPRTASEHHRAMSLPFFYPNFPEAARISSQIHQPRQPEPVHEQAIYTRSPRPVSLSSGSSGFTAGLALTPHLIDTTPVTTNLAEQSFGLERITDLSNRPPHHTIPLPSPQIQDIESYFYQEELHSEFPPNGREVQPKSKPEFESVALPQPYNSRFQDHHEDLSVIEEAPTPPLQYDRDSFQDWLSNPNVLLDQISELQRLYSTESTAQPLITSDESVLDSQHETSDIAYRQPHHAFRYRRASQAFSFLVTKSRTTLDDQNAEPDHVSTHSSSSGSLAS